MLANIFFAEVSCNYTSELRNKYPSKNNILIETKLHAVSIMLHFVPTISIMFQFELYFIPIQSWLENQDYGKDKTGGLPIWTPIAIKVIVLLMTQQKNIVHNGFRQYYSYQYFQSTQYKDISLFILHMNSFAFQQTYLGVNLV
ncbi:UNKNOWN [Stylonychia lemnae]|uniref:Uncharacterized protein n=1 Tax=Stylonychia lemnae TaxID=5949 RepID=A0A078B6Y1_STYLE|nr:UNKNOWN [Stylonychia lemnae]|eukprot:CDW89318.1 UNKNOWN [Stylonychia lemnae]